MNRKRIKLIDDVEDDFPVRNSCSNRFRYRSFNLLPSRSVAGQSRQNILDTTTKLVVAMDNSVCPALSVLGLCHEAGHELIDRTKCTCAVQSARTFHSKVWLIHSQAINVSTKRFSTHAVGVAQYVSQHLRYREGL
ncbi:uncharacterized protein PHALS_00326 [Plasmopara halstedii]|uniref:Uncharacterized protein n=1 Tax=Plasmopara halstedii TaxID=4781 RepID=A0A0P1A738_PLAHL|nr:uncharacterized protein PHALS_00326 [Plasmopara halstedii]CEG36004.1 hypothetical protein PHALS_00326 [Plasmopara halstedii]|eukprot:XP_024572373.1 hypothetical protein PHALS_00326 [Plasmopara halstedii]